MALLVHRGALVEPWLARIERRGDAVTVSSPLRIDNQITASLDLAWADATTLVVLATGSAAPELLEITVGSSLVRRQAAPDAAATTVAAAPGAGRADLVADRTSTWRQTGTGWARIEGVTDPVYPG